ncbi:hypothetical protein SAMN03080615_01667 [Amphritea atlantica]|uniref:Uncharacterized protein n=1 Tax=Amphritea atlantica TaxID=355243 RepID=A0A1H9GH35_9GAMM|nr:hypothetical protein [Amphritea atlantica]SEQ49178.1 hypothetical protein SAMN03080615_01667 [Amphritea atlantica]
MKKSNVRIVSNGKAKGSQVLVDGVPLDGVQAIAIHTIKPGGNVVVDLRLNGVELDVVAEARLPEIES